jgi:hypothetical protein
LEYYSVITTAIIVITPIFVYRAGRPRVFVRPRIVSLQGKNYLSVELLNNRGRAITVDIVSVELLYFYGDRQIRTDSVKPKWEGPSLPFRLDGDSRETWQAPADFLSDFVDLHDQSNSMKLKVKLGGHRWDRPRLVKIGDPIIVDDTGRPLA